MLNALVHKVREARRYTRLSLKPLCPHFRACNGGPSPFGQLRSSSRLTNLIRSRTPWNAAEAAASSSGQANSAIGNRCERSLLLRRTDAECCTVVAAPTSAAPTVLYAPTLPTAPPRRPGRRCLSRPRCLASPQPCEPCVSVHMRKGEEKKLAKIRDGGRRWLHNFRLALSG